MASNLILDRIVRANRDLQRVLEPIAFARGDVIGAQGDTVRFAVFPHAGLLSMVVPLPDGEQVEAAVVGCQAAVGMGAAFGSHAHVNTAFGQIAGNGYAVPIQALRNALDGDPELTKLIFSHEQYLLAQAQQTAACNARHPVVHRLANWLLRVHDATGATELKLTQEYVSQMLGVQRATVTGVAGHLQESGLISYRRGNIKLLNVSELEQESCGCFRILREQQSLLLASKPATCGDVVANGVPATGGA